MADAGPSTVEKWLEDVASCPNTGAPLPPLPLSPPVKPHVVTAPIVPLRGSTLTMVPTPILVIVCAYLNADDVEALCVTNSYARRFGITFDTALWKHRCEGLWRNKRFLPPTTPLGATAATPLFTWERCDRSPLKSETTPSLTEERSSTGVGDVGDGARLGSSDNHKQVYSLEKGQASWRFALRRSIMDARRRTTLSKEELMTTTWVLRPQPRRSRSCELPPRPLDVTFTTDGMTQKTAGHSVAPSVPVPVSPTRYSVVQRGRIVVLGHGQALTVTRDIPPATAPSAPAPLQAAIERHSTATWGWVMRGYYLDVSSVGLTPPSYVGKLLYGDVSVK